MPIHNAVTSPDDAARVQAYLMTVLDGQSNAMADALEARVMFAFANPQTCHLTLSKAQQKKFFQLLASLTSKPTHPHQLDLFTP